MNRYAAQRLGVENAIRTRETDVHNTDVQNTDVHNTKVHNTKVQNTGVHSGSLILVNREHPAVTDETRLAPFRCGRREVMLEARAANLLTELVAYTGTEGEILPADGYRSRERQREIYRNSLRDNGAEFTGRYVAEPGCSEHHTGLAVDLALSAADIDAIRPDFPYSGAAGRFRKHAAKYGFVERYGRDKEKITGIAHEPWHFRYVGYPHSRIMEENGFCLEEYIDVLRRFPFNGEHLIIREISKELEIYFLPESEMGSALQSGRGGPHDFRDSGWHQVSGNNVDGFIITIWRSTR